MRKQAQPKGEELTFFRFSFLLVMNYICNYALAYNSFIIYVIMHFCRNYAFFFFHWSSCPSVIVNRLNIDDIHYI
jgi:hypothetical protein